MKRKTLPKRCVKCKGTDFDVSADPFGNLVWYVCLTCNAVYTDRATKKGHTG